MVLISGILHSGYDIAAHLCNGLILEYSKNSTFWSIYYAIYKGIFYLGLIGVGLILSVKARPFEENNHLPAIHTKREHT